MMQKETAEAGAGVGEGENGSKVGVRFTGIRYRKWGKWAAEIRLCKPRSKLWLGTYATPHEAAMAYDAALFCLRGPNSKFNLPDSCNRISSLLCARTSMSTDEIKNFSRHYALQLQQRRTENAVADADPSSSCCSRALDGEYAAAVVASLELEHQLWDMQENVARFEAQMYHPQQHFNHEHDTTDDDGQSQDQYFIDSIWTD